MKIDLGRVVGADGKSAYQIAVEHGFEGTEQEWIDSLNYDDDISALDEKINQEIEDRTNADTEIQNTIESTVNNAIAELVANAPEDLDTLKEIADWISEHSEDASAMNSAILENKNAILENKNAIETKADSSHTNYKLSKQFYGTRKGRYVKIGSIPISSGVVSYVALKIAIFSSSPVSDYPTGIIELGMSSGNTATSFNINGFSTIPLNSDTIINPRIVVEKTSTDYILYVDCNYNYLSFTITELYSAKYTRSNFEEVAALNGTIIFNSTEDNAIKYLNDFALSSHTHSDKANYRFATMVSTLKFTRNSYVSVRDFWSKLYSTFGGNGVIQFSWEDANQAYVGTTTNNVVINGGTLIYTANNAPNLWTNFSAIYYQGGGGNDVYHIKCRIGDDDTVGKEAWSITRVVKSVELNNYATKTELNGKADSSHEHTSLKRTQLAAGTDLNTIKNQGEYYAIDNASYPNAPCQNFTMQVITLMSGYSFQKLYAYGSGKIYTRSTYYDSGAVVWSSWREHTSTNEVFGTDLSDYYYYSESTGIKFYWYKIIDSSSFNATGKRIKLKFKLASDNNYPYKSEYVLDVSHYMTTTTKNLSVSLKNIYADSTSITEGNMIVAVDKDYNVYAQFHCVWDSYVNITKELGNINFKTEKLSYSTFGTESSDFTPKQKITRQGKCKIIKNLSTGVYTVGNVEDTYTFTTSSKATADASGNNIVYTYATKTELNSHTHSEYHSKTDLNIKNYGFLGGTRYIEISSYYTFAGVEVNIPYSGKWYFATPGSAPLYFGGDYYTSYGVSGWAWSSDNKKLYLKISLSTSDYKPVSISVLGSNANDVSISGDSTSAPSGITFNTNVYDIKANIDEIEKTYATKTELYNIDGLKKYTKIDLSSKSTYNFYPVIITGRTRTAFKEVMITSAGGSSSIAYNQNRIHFTISNDGWNDTPKSLFIQEYACYDNKEITIGCIGYGNKGSQNACVWLRGGKTYDVFTMDCYISSTGADVIENANDSNYSKFTVGTNYYGGTNTNVDIVFTPQTTIINGLYSSRAITAPKFNGLASKATADASGNNIEATYAKKSDLANAGMSVSAKNVMEATGSIDFNTNKATIQLPIYSAEDTDQPTTLGAMWIQEVKI